MVALPELEAMQQSYELLHPLDRRARRRVLKWLRDALDNADTPPTAAADGAREANGAPAVYGDASAALQRDAAADAPAAPAAAVEEPASTSVDEAAAQQQDAATTGDSTDAPATDSATVQAAPTRRRRQPAKKAPTPPAAAKQTTKAAARKTTPAAMPAPAKRQGMPPAEEIMDVYKRVGTLRGVEQHYGKSSATVQSWARALREQGHAIGRVSKS